MTATPRCAHRFSEAIGAGRISKVEKINDCCVLAAVGHQMASRKGVAATMFSALAKANINIRCTTRALHPGVEGESDRLAENLSTFTFVRQQTCFLRRVHQKSGGPAQE